MSPLLTPHDVNVHNPRMEATDPTGGHDPPPADGGPGRSARPASILDVAAAAGVSYQTVSRVINGHPSVRPATRELVLAAIEQLGFRPNRAARVLRGARARSVTVV